MPNSCSATASASVAVNLGMLSSAIVMPPDIAGSCRSTLSVRRSALKLRQFPASGVDPHDAWIGTKVHREAPCIEHLRNQTHIGDGRRIAVTKTPRRRVSNQPTLQSVEPKLHPVPIPGLARRLVLMQILLEILQHPQVVQGMH